MTLKFTGRAGRQVQRMLGSLSRAQRSELDYYDLAQSLGGQDLQRSLLEALSEHLTRTLSIQIAPAADTLELEIEEIVLLATDPAGPLTSLWRLNARIESRGQAVWRACHEWTLDLGFTSMEQLAAGDREQRLKLLNQMASEVARRTAESLSADGFARRGEKT